MNTTNTLNKLDDLLGSAFTRLIPELSNHTQAIEHVLDQNELNKQTKLKSIGNVGHVGKYLQKEVKNIEILLAKKHPATNLTNKKSLTTTINNTLTYLHSINEEGYFVKESVLKKILDEHPPTNLLNLPDSILDSLTILEKASLTRHTESKDWQDSYLNRFSNLQPKDFEVRRVNFAIFNTPEVIELMDASSMKQKPWRMSHSKETGYINVFTQDEESIESGTPVLQFFLVLFHYYYENLLSSGVARRNKNSEAIGTFLRNIIISGKDQYDFFHPNCYSEHVFWMRGFASMQSYFTEIDFSLFIDSMTTGGYVNPNKDDSEIITFNIIDQVWNLNHTGDSTYFDIDSDSFYYHFREGLWFDIMAEVSGHTQKNMEEFILSNLFHGDQMLTKTLLK